MNNPGYLFLVALTFLHGQRWHSFDAVWGRWYLFEIGIVAVAMVLLLAGAAKQRLGVIRIGAVLAILGVIFNRLNVSVIAFKWYDAAHYFPSRMEFVVSAGIICAEIWVFRWVVLRMPVVSSAPEWARHLGQGPDASARSEHVAA